MDDSGDDLFITQSTFRTEVDTQDASEAVDYFDTSIDFLHNDTDAPEVVQYWDFSDEVCNAESVVDKPVEGRPEQVTETPLSIDANVIVGQEPIISLENKLDDAEVDAVSDEVVSAALQAVLGNAKDLNRCGDPVTDTDVSLNTAKGYSAATKKKAKWAHNVYFHWKVARNMKAIHDPRLKFITGDILELSKEDLSYALTRFIMEVRNKKGEVYPSDTLYELVIALQMYCQMYGRNVRFLDEEDEHFVKVHHALDNQMKLLASKGHTCPREKADPIEVDDENVMWEQGVLGDSDGKQLVDTLLYLFGVHFALRAVKEHKSLRVGDNSQLLLKLDRQANLYYLEYTEDTSKNNQGGLRHRRIQRKSSRAYENKSQPDRCVVHLYRKYMSLRPKDNCSTDFYLRPLAHPKPECWYMTQPMGVNTISKIVSGLAAKVGIEGKITNHSCRASSASRIYQGNCDEQLVMEKTGHHSNAVRSYKRTSSKQLHKVSDLLYGQDSTKVEGEPVEKAPKLAASTIVKASKEASCTGDSVTVSTADKASTISVNLTINVNK